MEPQPSAGEQEHPAGAEEQWAPPRPVPSPMSAAAAGRVPGALVPVCALVRSVA